MCGCLGYDLESGGDYLEVMNSLVLVEDMLRPFDESTTREVVSIICSAPMAEGDQLQVRTQRTPPPKFTRRWLLVQFIYTGRL